MRECIHVCRCCLHFCAGITAVPAIAADGLSTIQLAAVKSATVFIRTITAAGEMQGSGFLAQKNLVVTNAHVVAALRPGTELQPRTLRMCFNSGQGKAELVCDGYLSAADQASDLAFIKLRTPPAAGRAAGCEEDLADLPRRLFLRLGDGHRG